MESRPIFMAKMAKTINVGHMTDEAHAAYHSTRPKEVWTPAHASSQQQLINKFVEIEGRLDNIEHHIGLKDKDKEEELKRSREEVADMKQTLEAALERLAIREKELMDTRDQLNNLTNQTAIDRRKIDELEKEREKMLLLVKELESKLNERERKIYVLEDQLHILKADLGTTQGKLDTTQEQLELHRAQLRKTNKSVKKMETQMEEVLRRMDYLAVSSKPTMALSSRAEKFSGQTSLSSSGPLALPPIRLSKEKTKMNFPPRD